MTKKYSLKMVFHYTIETDDIERTLREFEFPSFPYPEDEDESKIIFEDNLNEYVEIKENDCPECGAYWETDGELNLLTCKTCQERYAEMKA